MPFRAETPERVDQKVRENTVPCRAPERVDQKVREDAVPSRVPGQMSQKAGNCGWKRDAFTGRWVLGTRLRTSTVPRDTDGIESNTSAKKLKVEIYCFLYR